MTRILLLLIVALLLGGCAQVQDNPGEIIGRDFDLSQWKSIKANLASLQQVKTALGDPFQAIVDSDPTTGKPRSVWTYYFERGKLGKERILWALADKPNRIFKRLVITFDEEGTVKEISPEFNFEAEDSGK